jgi:hypothetical protein
MPSDPRTLGDWNQRGEACAEDLQELGNIEKRTHLLMPSQSKPR